MAKKEVAKKVESNQVTLDEFLAHQNESGKPFYTLSPVRQSPSKIRVTPVLGGAGCGCDLSFLVERTDVQAVVPLGVMHKCSGTKKMLVKVLFKDGATISLIDLLDSVAATLRRRRQKKKLRQALFRFNPELPIDGDGDGGDGGDGGGGDGGDGDDGDDGDGDDFGSADGDGEDGEEGGGDNGDSQEGDGDGDESGDNGATLTSGSGDLNACQEMGYAACYAAMEACMRACLGNAECRNHCLEAGFTCSDLVDFVCRSKPEPPRVS